MVISYGVYITQLIRFAGVSSHVADFNTRNKILTAIFSNKATGITNTVTLFTEFCLRHYDLVSKFNVGLKSLFKKDHLEPKFYGDLENCWLE